MSAAKALRARLLADAELSALVATRIFPHRAPQDTARPLMVYSRLSTEHEQSLTGRAGLTVTRFQVEILADTQATVEAIGVRVRESLNGFIGDSAGTAVQGTWLEDEQDSPEIIEGSDGLLYHALLDVVMQTAE